MLSDFLGDKMLIGSKRELEPGRGVDLSRSGIQHSRNYHAKQYHRFTLSLRLSPDEFAGLLALYEDEADLEHLIEYHGKYYYVKFLEPPQPVLNREDRTYLVEVSVRGYVTEV